MRYATKMQGITHVKQLTQAPSWMVAAGISYTGKLREQMAEAEQRQCSSPIVPSTTLPHRLTCWVTHEKGRKLEERQETRTKDT